MRAAVWHNQRDVRIEDVQSPPPPPRGQVQVKVSWCGICGTDLHEYLGGPIYIPVGHPHPLTGVQAPVIIGHEMSGEVLDVGQDVADFAPGDRVAACPIIGCGTCRWCRSGSMAQCDRVAFLGTSWTGGALAERLNLHAYQCYRLPQSISDDTGALVEPFSAVVRAIDRSAPKAEERVAVVGAGPMGLMTIMATRIFGCAHVVAFEPASRRRETAKLCGAEAVVDPALEDAEKCCFQPGAARDRYARAPARFGCHGAQPCADGSFLRCSTHAVTAALQESQVPGTGASAIGSGRHRDHVRDPGGRRSAGQ